MKKFTILGDGYTMLVAVEDRVGKITSNLKGEDADPSETHMDAQLDVVESIVLAHAVAGIDVADPKYVEGLNTTVNAIVR